MRKHIIEANYTNEVTVDDVADHVHMSKRNFIRRFKRAVQLTPLEYTQRVKIEAAKKALESDEQSIQSLPFKVGYNDTKTFRDTFKRFTGLTPLQYRRKYGRRAGYVRQLGTGSSDCLRSKERTDDTPPALLT